MSQRVFKDPLQKIQEKYIIIDMKIKSMQNSITSLYKDKKNYAMSLISKLDALSTLKTLTRGYSIVTMHGNNVKSVKNIGKDDEIDIRFMDGNAKAKVL